MAWANSDTFNPFARSSFALAGSPFVVPRLPSFVDALPLGHLDACRLPLGTILQFDLRQAEEQGGNHPADRPVEFDLLGDHHDLHPLLAPVGEDAVSLLANAWRRRAA
jgi:hypothetical protein